MNVETWTDCNGGRQGCLRDEGRAVAGARGDEDIGKLRRIAHRYNNFDELLDAADCYLRFGDTECRERLIVAVTRAKEVRQ